MIDSIDIKKCALSVLKGLAGQRNDAQLDIMKTGLLQQALANIKAYPADDLDQEVLGLFLDLLSCCVSRPIYQL
jgi:hypothetical protein